MEVKEFPEVIAIKGKGEQARILMHMAAMMQEIAAGTFDQIFILASIKNGGTSMMTEHGFGHPVATMEHAIQSIIMQAVSDCDAPDANAEQIVREIGAVLMAMGMCFARLNNKEELEAFTKDAKFIMKPDANLLEVFGGLAAHIHERAPAVRKMDEVMNRMSPEQRAQYQNPTKSMMN